MIKHEIRRATQRKDWDTVQKLETILKTKADRRLTEINIQKAQQDIKTSLRNFVLGILGLIATGIGLLIKVLFNHK